MGVASGCGEQEVGVASGNGWMGVVLFYSSIPTFVHLKKCFSFLVYRVILGQYLGI